LIESQGADLDESLGAAVEGLSIERKNGYQLLDDLSGDEAVQVLAELDKGEG
jgi:hypothetical protein